MLCLETGFRLEYGFFNDKLFTFTSETSISYKSSVTGSSTYPLNTANHSAPTAPSTTRWSQAKVATTTGAT